MRDRAAEPGRGRVARALLGLTLAAGLFAAGTMVYGIYNFLDAPIRKTASGYAGKTGKPRTEAEYEAFQVWQKALFASFGASFVLGFAFAAADRVERRRAKRQVRRRARHRGRGRA